METRTHRSFNYRIPSVIGLLFMALVLAEASTYLQNKPFFKMFDHAEDDLDAMTERPANLWTQRDSHNFSGTPARISPTAAKRDFFTHLLAQGKQQMQKQDFTKALITFEKALAFDSRDPALYYLLAELHGALGRYALSDRFRKVGDAFAIRPNPVARETVANSELVEATPTAPLIIEMSAQPASEGMLDGSQPN
jgi:tetratricopeptide (TPR) repeat protein